MTQDIKTPFFNLIDIGERSGSGIPSIFSVWNQNGFEEPQLIENFEPERIKLKLSFHKIGDKQSTVKEEKLNKIIEYLTVRVEARSSDIAEYVNLKPSRVRDYLNELIKNGIIIAEGANRNRTYRLKEISGEKQI